MYSKSWFELCYVFDTRCSNRFMFNLSPCLCR